MTKRFIEWVGSPPSKQEDFVVRIDNAERVSVSVNESSEIKVNVAKSLDVIVDA